MIYVFDTNSFLELQSYYPETFPTFWERFEDLVQDGRLTSVREVRKELEFLTTADHLTEWVAHHSDLFVTPSSEEMTLVAEIFQIPHFQQLIGQKQMERGQAVADPFLVARGWHLGGCVVTEERHKPNASKIPNVCEHFGVSCCKLQGLMAAEAWRF